MRATKFRCPYCKKDHFAEQWTDEANDSGEYSMTMCAIEFEENQDFVRDDWLWICPSCKKEVYGNDIEEVEVEV